MSSYKPPHKTDAYPGLSTMKRLALMQRFLKKFAQKTPPRLGSNSASGYAEVFQYLIASRTAQQLLENLSIISIFNSGLHARRRVENKINRS